jgi:NADH-quinone oxidoreductase subunit E
MLSEQERQEIDAERSNYFQKDAVRIDALKIVQRHRGWVSDEAIQDLADYLEMTPDELDSIATFYNLIYRKPVGKHVILMCNSVTCWIMGYERLRQEISKQMGIDLGQTSPDGGFTFLPMVCIGNCDHAPAMMIDDDQYGDVTPAQLEELLRRYQKD